MANVFTINGQLSKHRQTVIDTLLKFFVGILGISCVFPNFAGHFLTFPTVGKLFSVYRTVKDRTGISFRHKKNFSRTFIAASTHIPVVGTSTAIGSTTTDITHYNTSSSVKYSPQKGRKV